MLQERLVGGAVVALGMLLFFVLIPMGIDSPGEVDHASLSPDFWPKIIVAIFSAMGLFVLIKPLPAPVDDEGGVQSASWLSRAPRLLLVLTVLFCFYFLIDQLGMVVPGIAVIFGMMFFAGERRWLLMAIIAIVVPVMLYVFFVHVANIPIPLGIFEVLRG